MESLTAHEEQGETGSVLRRWMGNGRLVSWRASPVTGIGAAVVGVILTTWLLRSWATRLHLSNVAMAYLLVVLGVATTFGRAPAIVAAILAFLTFDWNFVHPVGHLTVSDPNEWLMLIVFLITGLTTGQLAGALRQRAQEAREGQQESRLLYDLTGAMSSQADLASILELTARRVREVFRAESCEFLLRDGEGRLPATEGGLDINTRRPYGSRALPLRAGEHDFGVAYVGPRQGGQDYGEKEQRLLATFTGHAALAIERTRLARALNEAQLVRESDALKSALLSSISHDLRSPLAAIKAFATGLLEGGAECDAATVREGLAAIDHESDRLNRLVGNLLDISRLQAGALRMNCDSYAVAEVVAEVVGRMARGLAGHPLEVRIPDDLPAVWIDCPLIQQVLTNLLENAVKHTPPATPIRITARRTTDGVAVSVADEGPGIAPSQREAVFARFYRLEESEGKRAGTGLGLAICRGFVEAHGGAIWIEESERGTHVTFSLPLAAVEAQFGEEVGPRGG
jgi:two-component system sensor histidine kinase KdpD